mmetsp:Transcript_14348/g.19982  ORF Transcript_14348/g.19982 Transcript_14348/m.19982 type:complete len:236 (-) Transcript_14348:75-782(-)
MAYFISWRFTVILLNVIWLTNAAAESECFSEPKGFHWSASLDRPTGIATSIETSCVLKGNPLHRTLSQVKPKQQLNSVRKYFEAYPFWVGRPAVTFGLLRTVQEKGNEVTSIQDVLFGINLLSFGRPQSRVQKDPGTHSKRLTVTLPIAGGLLAWKNNNRHDIDLGCLLFSLVLKPDRNFFIETEISGYHPAIAGGPPVSKIRKWTYRSTQSYVHAYVMWRFHNYCRRLDEFTET